jgi:glycerophosphoryl diester phosphodiesterase
MMWQRVVCFAKARLELWIGRSRGEVVRSLAIVALAAAVGVLAAEVRQLSRSPNPAEWNHYSAEANAHLYTGAAPPVPSLAVAHAGGEIGGKTYTNSIEALEENYRRGYRLFELDFDWTADNELVATHNWAGYRGPRHGGAPTLADFLAQTPGPFRPASRFMIYEWLTAHGDAYIITDVKNRSLEALAQIRMERPALVPRFIPQIYLFKDYELAASQGYRHIILTLYRCLGSTADAAIVDFARTRRLFAVTVPSNRCLEGGLAAELARMNVPVYVHTVNELSVYERLAARGAHGVYTDRLLPVEVASRASEPGRPLLWR